MSTSNDPKPLTRKELFEFLPSMRAVRAFEKLFEIVPPDLNALNNYLSAIRLQTVRTSLDYSVPIGNYLIEVDASLGPITITLPDAEAAFVEYNDEQFDIVIGITKVDTSSNAVIIDCQASQTILGELSQSLLVDGEVINVAAEVGYPNWELAS